MSNGARALITTLVDADTLCLQRARCGKGG